MSENVLRLSKRRVRNKPRINRSLGGNIVIFTFITLLGLFMALPLVYAVGNAFKPLEELWVFPPPLFPQNPTLKNFKDLMYLLQDSWVPISRYFFNTVFITVCATAGQVVFASMCAYAIAKRKAPGMKFMFSVIVLALMFSSSVTAIPNYITMVRLHMLDTYWALIIPAIGSPLGLYLMKQFMETSVPDTLLEAARIDGANELVIFFRMVMLLVKPAWLTLIVFTVQAQWNMGASVFIYTEQLKTLPYAISQIIAGGIARAGVGSAVTVVMMLVPILVFLFSQSNIVKTMSTSGMKE